MVPKGKKRVIAKRGEFVCRVGEGGMWVFFRMRGKKNPLPQEGGGLYNFREGRGLNRAGEVSHCPCESQDYPSTRKQCREKVFEKPIPWFRLEGEKWPSKKRDAHPLIYHPGAAAFRLCKSHSGGKSFSKTLDREGWVKGTETGSNRKKKKPAAVE